MIKNRIKEVATSRGVRTAYQLEKLLGCGSSAAYRIYAGGWTRVDLKTLNDLCSVLDCTPNDILEFDPDVTVESSAGPKTISIFPAAFDRSPSPDTPLKTVRIAISLPLCKLLADVP